jgi:hypothetical protein
MISLYAAGGFLLGAVPAFAAAWLLQRFWGVDVFAFYSASMRGSFFAGFLTIGGFMLSLKTFVLVKMKEGLYDSVAYRQMAEEMRGVGYREDIYAPLRRLSDLLFFAILSALITSALQLTLGLWRAWWSAAVCGGFAGGTLLLLLFSLVQIKRNLNTWFESLDRAGRQSQQPNPAAAATSKR